MEELLPGLLKMIEARIGRRVTYVFLWIVVFGIAAWMLNNTWNYLVAPLSEELEALLKGDRTVDWLRVAGIISSIFVIAASILGLLYMLLSVWQTRDVLKTLAQSEKQVQSLNELEKDMKAAQGRLGSN